MREESFCVDPIWRVIGASVRGTRHERTGEPCQDASAWCTLPDGTLVAAIADGASSAKLAHVGARLAVDSAISVTGRLLENELPGDEKDWRSLLIRVLGHAKAVVEEHAVIENIGSRELACTLIVIVACCNSIAAAQIGDGASVLGDEETVVNLTVPVFGEYVNETAFLLSPGAIENAQIQVCMVKPAKIALLSDGLQMLALRMPSANPHVPFFGPLFEFATKVVDTREANEELAKWMASPKMAARTDDDLTLLLAVRSN